MADWQPAEKVARNPEGKQVALMGGQWVPVERAAKNAEGKFMALRGETMGPRDVPDSTREVDRKPPEPGPSATDFLRGVPGALLEAGSGAVTGLAGRAVALVDPETGMKIADSQPLGEPSEAAKGTLRTLGKTAEYTGADKLAGLGPMAAPQLGKVPGVVAGAKGDAARIGALAKQEGELAGMAVKNRPGAKPSTPPSPLSSAQTKALETIEKLAGDLDVISGVKTEPIVKGSRPTLAEATGNPGLAQLQRTQQSKSTDFASDLHGRKAERLQARETAMEGISGSEGEMEALKTARQEKTTPLYKAAFETPVDPKRVTPAIQKEVSEFMQRPTVKEARTEAVKKALDSDEVLSEQDMGSVKGMHYMKCAIDDKISAAKRAGADDQVRIYLGIQEKMLGIMKEVSPEYAKAIKEFEAASKPINRLKVGQYLREKLFPSANRYGAGKMTVGQFAKALEHPDETAKLATGFSGAKMDKILTKDEISQLKSIAKDIVREQNVEGAARISGSQTAQLSAGQQRLTSFLEKLEKVPSKFVNLPAKGANLLLEKSRSKANAAYEQELNKMLSDPAYAKSVAAMRSSHSLRSVDPQTTKPWNIGLP